MLFFFFQAEDGIRDVAVTGVQTCALPDARCPFREPSVKSEAWFAIVALSVAACAPSQRPFSTAAPSPDPRVGLRAGWMDAGEAAWNIQLVSTTPPSPDFINRSNPGDF